MSHFRLTWENLSHTFMTLLGCLMDASGAALNVNVKDCLKDTTDIYYIDTNMAALLLS